MYYSSQKPRSAPSGYTQGELFDPSEFQLTPAMGAAQAEAAEQRELAYLRELAKKLPPTSHADRKTNPLPIPPVTQRIVRRRSKDCCEDCGHRLPLYFHHVHYRSLGRELPEDLAHLCRECHRCRHWKTGGFILVPDDPLKAVALGLLPAPAASQLPLVSNTTTTGF
jgi:hypothetical protein